jgi:vitamin B12 transporter
MNFIKIGFLVFACLGTFVSFGQEMRTDTTVIMNEVVVRSSRLQNFAIGSNVQKIDSISLVEFSNQSFADLLNSQSLVQINAYGSGGLSTPSVRGGGGSHTAVVWNGVNIQSPMNGSTNLALLPVRLLGNVNIQYGGSGTLLGNGAMSGAIYFDSQDLFNQKNNLTIGAGVASFGGRNLNLGTKIGNENIASSLSFYQHKANNDFKFKNTAKYQQPTEKQSNAEFSQSGFVFENKIRTGQKSILSSSFWFQEYDKNLQTLMIDSDIGKSSQYDKNIYALMRWQQTGKFFNFKIKTALINDIQKFENPSLPNPITHNRSLSSINEAELKWVMDEHQVLNLGLNYTYEEVSSDGYNGLASQNRISVFLSYKLMRLFNKLNVVNSIRKEMVDNGSLPFVYSLDANMDLSKSISVKGNLSKNYNLPSLNDLYWRSETYVSGNPDLKAEYGWSGEIGFTETLLASQPSIKLEQSFYHSQIKDWIVWLPGASGVWKPENKKNAKIAGLDLNMKMALKMNHVDFKLNAKYNWNSSRFCNKDDQFLPMIYVPENVFLLNLNVDFGELSINYSHKFSDARLYDQNHSLPSYHLAALSFNYQASKKKNTFNINFKINNIWNENYQLIAWYAMAPVHYQLSISYSLNNFLTFK